jgi:hypothetical protein
MLRAGEGSNLGRNYTPDGLTLVSRFCHGLAKFSIRIGPIEMGRCGRRFTIRLERIRHYEDLGRLRKRDDFGRNEMKSGLQGS